MAEGRMLKKKISVDVRWVDLADDTQRLLFTIAIAHLDIEGRISGDPREFKGAVAPILDHITNESVSKFFEDAGRLGLIQRYQVGGRWYIQFPGFHKNQKLRRNREAPSLYPAPPEEFSSPENDSDLTPGELPENSRIAPGERPEDSGTTPAKRKISKDKLSEGKEPDAHLAGGKATRRPSISADGLAKLWNQVIDPFFPKVRLPLAENRARKVRPAAKDHPDGANLYIYRYYLSHSTY